MFWVGKLYSKRQGSLSEWMQILNQKKGTTMVRAKFVCNSVEVYTESKKAKLSAVYSNDTQENADFTKYTPSGNIEILITNEAKAAEYFIPGEQYYVDFSNVNGKIVEPKAEDLAVVGIPGAIAADTTDGAISSADEVNQNIPEVDSGDLATTTLASGTN